MRSVIAFLIVVLGLAGCGGSTRNENLETAKKVERAIAAAPTREMIVDLEKKAFEAWKNKDSAFWNEHLDDKYLGFSAGMRVDKAGEIKLIGEAKCDVASFAISDEKLMPVGNDAIMLTAKATIEGSCSGQKIPSPYTFATLYVRSGGGWKAAYRNKTPTIDAPAPKPAAPAKPSVERDIDAFTSMLFAIEKRGWAEWKAKNRGPLEGLLTEDVTLVDATGKVAVGKQAVADWLILPKCDIKSAEPVSPAGSEISPVIAVLTFKGTVSGTCENRPLADFWGTSIYQKDGRVWKITYQFRTPV